MTKHTPAPWAAEMLDDTSGVLYGRADDPGDRVVIADFWRRTLRMEPQDTRFESDLEAEQNANMRLCASAPDLLRQRDELADALEKFMAVWDSTEYGINDVKDAFDAARTALANAGRRG